jgi:hypothetical protein
MMSIEHLENALTVGQFCAAEGICPATFYKLRRQGLGPVETRILGAVRISPQARRDWHAALAARAQGDAARLEAARKHAQASAAGKAAAKSPLHVNATGRRKRGARGAA